MATGFPHEQLDCYRLAVEVARWTAKAKFPPGAGTADLAVSIKLYPAEEGEKTAADIAKDEDGSSPVQDGTGQYSSSALALSEDRTIICRCERVSLGTVRRAIRSMPSLWSRSIARCLRAGVKLPPSGKITNASFSSRPRASSVMWRSTSPPRGSMNRAGIRLSRTSMRGSQARDAGLAGAELCHFFGGGLLHREVSLPPPGRDAGQHLSAGARRARVRADAQDSRRDALDRVRIS